MVDGRVSLDPVGFTISTLPFPEAGGDGDVEDFESVFDEKIDDRVCVGTDPIASWANLEIVFTVPRFRFCCWCELTVEPGHHPFTDGARLLRELLGLWSYFNSM